MSLEHLDTVLSFAVVMLLFSVLVTALVQTVVAIFGLRGTNLLWGLDRLFQQVAPELNLKRHARQLADAVLTRPTLAHISYPRLLGGGGWWIKRRATAIRPGEIVRMMREIAEDPSIENKELQDAVKDTLTKTAPGASPDLVTKVEQVTGELAKIFPQQAEAVRDAANRAIEKTRVERKQIETEIGKWFDTVMDRTTERFALRTRWVTVIFAFLLVATLQIDALAIFRQLAENPSLRTRLIEAADETLDQAEVAVGETGALKPLATEAIRRIDIGQFDEIDRELLAGVPPDLVTRRQGREWLTRTFSEEELLPVLGAYSKHFEDIVVTRVKELSVSFQEVRATLDQGGLHLIPWPPPDPWYGWRHLLGMLMSIGFLSLGAPFWFNALRQLVNLRPYLAKKIEDERLAA